MPSAGFEPAIPASERQQTLALDGWTAGIGMFLVLLSENELNVESYVSV